MTPASTKPFSIPQIQVQPVRFDSLTVEQLRFFKTETGIDDEDKLREHMVAVQRAAHEVMNPG